MFSGRHSLLRQRGLQLLEVDREAGDASIKKAFKRAALKQHPDKVPAEERAAAEQHFKLLVDANDILQDRDKRSKYDAGWSKEEIEQGFQEGDCGPSFGAGGMDMEEMLATMFAQSRRHGGMF